IDGALVKETSTVLDRVKQRQWGAVAEALRKTAKAAERIRSSFPDWMVKPEVQSGKPSDRLLVRADEWKPDLIVAGSHGRSAIGRLVLGSVSHHIVTDARCSVRIA